MSRILLVDSDPNMIHVCRTVLEGAGHQLLTALDAWEAIRMVASRPPDVVLTAPTIGNVDAAVLCRSLLHEAAPLHPVMVLLSAAPIRYGGYDEHLQTPFKADELTDVISRARSRHRDTALTSRNEKQCATI